MSCEWAIKAQGLSKCYQMYSKPHFRLLQMLAGRYRQYYQEFWALKDISLTINKGQTVGIIGRNGSGKSTLLQLLCGTLNPTRGQMETHGRIAALLELGSGFNPEFTGRENVFLNAELLGLTRHQIEERYTQIIDFADIGDFVNQPVKTYSSGMLVRLAFAVIAHVDADILIIDEALAVGDAFFTQKCMRFLRTFMRQGTVLFVSHDTNSVKSLCHRVIWLENGQMRMNGTPKQVCEAYLEAQFEAQNGKTSLNPLLTSAGLDEEPLEFKDQRLEFMQRSNLRNDIQLFRFDPNAASLGAGGARITGVSLLDRVGYPLTWVVGGERVILQIKAVALQALDKPIIGFFMKDRLGQTLFGDNTFLTCYNQPVAAQVGEILQAEFVFDVPILPKGDYMINVAIANGTQEDHVQHHMIHDALLVKSEMGDYGVTGLLGIPMRQIRLNALKATNKVQPVELVNQP